MLFRIGFGLYFIELKQKINCSSVTYGGRHLSPQKITFSFFLSKREKKKKKKFNQNPKKKKKKTPTPAFYNALELYVKPDD